MSLPKLFSLTLIENDVRSREDLKNSYRLRKRKLQRQEKTAALLRAASNFGKPLFLFVEDGPVYS